MRFANEKMTDSKVQQDKLGNFAKRSTRNKWAESIEEDVRSAAPFPISYDVNYTQGTGFTEYTYTEICGGMWVATQSLELNTRLMDFASKEKAKVNYLDDFKSLLSDKYILNSSIDISELKRVCFLPGHNLLDVASIEIISKLAHENDDIYFKPHPITNDEAISLVARRVGWNKIIHKDISGFHLLANCDEVYTSSASEMCITGTLLNKKVYNVSNFFNEGAGTYYPISRILFRAHEREGLEGAREKLNNIIACEWTGLIFPFHSNLKERIEKYYDKSLELRELYKPLAAPRGNIDAESKRIVNAGK